MYKCVSMTTNVEREARIKIVIGTKEYPMESSFTQRVEYLLDCILWMVITELLVTLHKNRTMAMAFSILGVIKSLYFRSCVIIKNLSTEITAVNRQENVYGKYWKMVPRIIRINGVFCRLCT